MARLSLAKMYLKEMEIYRRRGIELEDESSLEKYLVMRKLLEGRPASLPEIVKYIEESTGQEPKRDFSQTSRRMYERIYKFLRRLEKRGFLTKISLGRKQVITLKPQILKEVSGLFKKEAGENGFLIPFIELDELRNQLKKEVIDEVVEQINTEIVPKISDVESEVNSVKKDLMKAHNNLQCVEKAVSEIAEIGNQNFSQLQSAIYELNKNVESLWAIIEKIEREFGSALKEMAVFLTEEISVRHIKMSEDDHPSVLKVKNGAYSWKPVMKRSGNPLKVDIRTI